MRLLVPALVLLCAPLAAQPTGAPEDTPLREGARALVFQVGPDLTLGGLDGGTVAYKRHRSEARALRVGVTVDASAEVDFDNDADRERVALSATALGLRYRRSRTPVSLYTGFGPTGQIIAQRVDGGAGPSTSVVDLSLGLAGVVGVEWVVAEAIGVTGEYGQALLVGGRVGDGGDVLRLEARPRGARLGVSVYF
jgi:hypothetical protein